MSGYIDLNYISKIQPRLQQFKKKRDYLFNFRCPVCGDSKKSKTKARAYLYRVKNDMFFKCHNCSASHNLANLIKIVDRPLYDQYILERYKGSKPASEESLFGRFKTDTKAKLKSTPLQGLTASYQPLSVLIRPCMKPYEALRIRPQKARPHKATYVKL